MATTDLPLEELARRITSGAVRLAAATAAWLALIAEFDRREGWGGHGIRSCAHWLAWQCGLSTGTAREHVRVARALTALPQTAQAFASGRLTYSKVRAITRVADPATETALLDLAHETTASQLERVVREWRRDERPDPRTVRDKQRFDHWWDDDGMLHLRACLDAETGAAFLAGVESLVERTARRERAAAKKAPPTGDAPGESAAVPAEPGEPSRPGVASAEPAEPCDVPAGTHPSPLDEDDELALARERTTARRCATLAQLATAAADADRRAGDPPRREVVIHVDAAVLADDTAAGVAHLDGGPALHPTTVRRMLCEATVVTMLSNGREPLALGRARRFATRAQRRALYRRDRGCARPGCPETRPERLHAHHLRHWLFGGRTDISNMALLCDTDHGLAHDLDLVLSRRDGQLIALTPDGQRIWGPPDAAFTTGLTALVDHPAAPGHPDGTGHPDAVRPAPGDPFVGVHPIDQLRARRPDVPAGTSPVPPTPDARAGTPGAGAVTGGATISELLTPGTAPEVPDALHVNGEPMDLEYVVWALLAHRDLARRLAAEGAVENRTAAA